MRDSWLWQEHKKEVKTVSEKKDEQGDINISSNFSKHKVVMVIGKSGYNWTATLETESAREYARQLIAAADAVDKARPQQQTTTEWKTEEK